MASGSQVKAGGAYVELSADNSPLLKGLNKGGAALKEFGDKVSSIGKQFSIMGAAITAPLAAMVTLSTNAGAAIYDMSRRTGASVEALSRLGFAANMTGTDMETVEVGIKRMQKSIAGVKDEFEGTTGSLSHLGLAMEDIKNLSPDQQFALIASKISDIKDPAARTAAAMSVFGRSGTMLIPMLEQLGELSGKADAFGLVRSAESARNAKEYTMTMTLLTSAMKSVNSAITSALLPTFKHKAELLVRLTFAMKKIIKENPALVQGAFQIGAAFTVAGVGLYAAGKAIGFAGGAMKTLAAVLGVIVSPLGLLVAGLASVAAYAVYAGGGFTVMQKIANEAIKGISDALMAGDIKLASQILWASLRLGWTELKNDLLVLFDDITNAYAKGWINAIAEVKKVMATATLPNALKIVRMDKVSGDLQSEMTRAQNLKNDPAMVAAMKAQGRDIVGEVEGNIKRLRAELDALMNDSDPKKKIDDIERERRQSLAALKQANDAGDKEKIKQYQDQMKALEAELAALKARAASEHHDAPALPAPPTNPIPGSELNVPTARSGSSSGTFNHNAFFGLGGAGGPQERTAKAAERMEAQVAVIARKLWGASVAAGTAGIGWL